MADETMTTSDAVQESGSIAVMDEQEIRELQERWTSIQSSFIDEPRSSVTEADRLVGDVTGRIATRFEEERAGSRRSGSPAKM